MQNIRFLAVSFLLLNFLCPLSRATDLTTVLNPGYLKLEAEAGYHFMELMGFSGSDRFSFQQTQITYPVRLHYGLARGVELAFTLPVSSGILFSSSETDLPDRVSHGLGDLEAGTKLKFLSDTENTPAIFVESLLNIPTGQSRFRDFVHAGEQPDFSGSGTDLGAFNLVLKGIVSMFLDPVEFYLQLRIDVPGSDEFTTAGGLQHIDYGTSVSLSGGVEADLTDNLTLAAEAVEISTAASQWTTQGVNALTLSGAGASALRARARTEAGVALGNITELYAGPALCWTFLPDTWIKVSGLVGLTPDSEKFRTRFNLSTAFSVGDLLKLKRGAGEGSSPVLEEAGAGEPSEAAESGNVRRFIKRQTERAESARQQGDLAQAIRELEQLLYQAPDYAPAQAELGRLQAELQAAVAASLEQAGQALQRADLQAAVAAWREVLRRDPRNAAALKGLRSRDAQIRELAKKFYLQGMQAYVQAQYENAIGLWQQALRLTPGDVKLKDSIAQTRKKMDALKQLTR